MVCRASDIFWFNFFRLLQTVPVKNSFPTLMSGLAMVRRNKMRPQRRAFAH